MNQFGFAHLPYALQQMQNPGGGYQLPQHNPSTTPSTITGPGSGVKSFLGNSQDMQAMLQQIQQNPGFAVTGTTVPQNSWNGTQFNIAAPSPPTAPEPTPAPAPTPGPASTISTPAGWGSPWDPRMFEPIGQKTSGSWAQPTGPAPAGYVWDSSQGYYRLPDWRDDDNWGD